MYVYFLLLNFNLFVTCLMLSRLSVIHVTISFLLKQARGARVSGLTSGHHGQGRTLTQKSIPFHAKTVARAGQIQGSSKKICDISRYFGPGLTGFRNESKFSLFSKSRLPAVRNFCPKNRVGPGPATCQKIVLKTRPFSSCTQLDHF